ncbi:hypothetical protein ACLMJK_009065 [Lecanora helva]
MAAQIAKSDFASLRTLDSHLRSKDATYLRDTSVQDLLQELLPCPTTNDRLDLTCVLIFDGLDQLPDQEAAQLLDAILAFKSSTVRFLITGAESILSSRLQLSEEVSTISVQEHNKIDIEDYIESRLKDSEAFVGNAPEILRISAQIQTKLPDVANGNFQNVGQIINRITGAIESEQSEEDITKLISADTLREKRIAIQELIVELNGSLMEEEIEQLNELLIWVIYAWKDMSVTELRAALFLLTKRTPFKSLEDKVGQKYGKILRIEQDVIYDDDKLVKIKNSELEDFFRDSKRENIDCNIEKDNDPRISMTISIDHVRLSQVQRFFWRVNEDMTFDKTAFASPLSDSDEGVGIRVNRTDANLILLSRCFDVLLEEPKEETQRRRPES